MAIIGISGKINSGKDTVGNIIRFLTLPEEFSKKNGDIIADMEYNWYCAKKSNWQIKKFAGKLKQIVSILTGISVEDLEKQEVKDSVLGYEWAKFLNYIPLSTDIIKLIQERGYKNAFYEQTLECFEIYQLPTVREMLQWVGTEAMRNKIHSNVWINALFADYKVVGKISIAKSINDIQEVNIDLTNKEHRELIQGEETHKNIFLIPNWIITDMRFPNELQAVKDRGGISIRVNRLNTELLDTDEKFNNEFNKYHHLSETALDNATFDYTIDNNGTIEELIEQVKQILIKENII